MNTPAFKHPLLIALPCFVADQITKWWVVLNLEYGSEHPVIPGFFDLVHYGNTGAAFGSFKNSNWFFFALSVVTFIGLLLAWRRGAFRDRLNWWGVGLLMGGILGNVTDRVIHKHVVDFLQFNLHLPYFDPWPSFNVADSCIFVAVCCFLLASYYESRAERRGAP